MRTGVLREPGRDGKRRPYVFSKVWNQIKASLGLDDLHFHDLRHEAVSRLVEAGFSDQEVSAISGHKSMQMLKRYTHLRAEDLVHRLDRIEQRRLASTQCDDEPVDVVPKPRRPEPEVPVNAGAITPANGKTGKLGKVKMN